MDMLGEISDGIDFEASFDFGDYEADCMSLLDTAMPELIQSQ